MYLKRQRYTNVYTAHVRRTFGILATDIVAAVDNGDDLDVDDDDGDDDIDDASLTNNAVSIIERTMSC